ncbi:MAG: hypothetical protein NWR99_09315 [Verrucomicrobiales bacterium]|nr:hypothetical protein [Verrucomicrobiales bacterium]
MKHFLRSQKKREISPIASDIHEDSVAREKMANTPGNGHLITVLEGMKIKGTELAIEGIELQGHRPPSDGEIDFEWLRPPEFCEFKSVKEEPVDRLL